MVKNQLIKVTKKEIKDLMAGSLADFYFLNEVSGKENFSLNEVEDILKNRVLGVDSFFKEKLNPTPKVEPPKFKNCECGAKMEFLKDSKEKNHYKCTKCSVETYNISMISNSLIERINKRINDLLKGEKNKNENW